MFICCINSIISCRSSDKVKMKQRLIVSEIDKDPAIFKILDTALYNFGVVQYGEVIRHNFHFKNIGNHPLIIVNASASCGCTVANYPKKPIRPNQEDSITIFFDTKLSSKGTQNKV